MLDDDQIYAEVVDAFCEALGLDEDEVEMDSLLMDDLGAESLDFLDIVFRLERSFRIKIPRGEIQRNAEESAGIDFEIDGVLTEAGLISLRQAMPEIPADRIQAGLCTRDIPRLFTVRTFHNMVVKLIAAKNEVIGANTAPRMAAVSA
jgi:acyl carrier protein